jgi:hypothetical protein
MNIRTALVVTFRSRRFWLWQICGCIIYGIPVLIRFTTGSMVIPILNFPGFWIGHFIPGNFLEKIIVNAFFPGGAGGIAGEIFFSNYQNTAINKKRKYVYRLAGSLLQTSAWSIFQFAGYYLLIMGPYGSNIFEHSIVFPINFILATFSIFTPDILNFMRLLLSRIFSRITVHRK